MGCPIYYYIISIRTVCRLKTNRRNESRFWSGIVLVAALLLAAIPLSRLEQQKAVTASAVTASAVTNWGLSFHQEGQTPQGNATSEQLKQFDAYYCGDSEEKVIYLTFDAGYENGCTEKILDTLKAHNVPGAFFLVGNYVEQNPELVTRMISEGHIVGNHTYSHPNMENITSKEAFAEELIKLEQVFEEVTGQQMSKYYRPPQGKYSEDNLELAKTLGYTTVLWSLAYVDWYEDDQPTAQEAFDKLIPRIHNGAVVLLHSTSQTNADILDELLTRWEDMGYTFGTLDQLADK
ncbi:MAG: delta-lactam-biosynthetic de-N-acetylase [Ruminococcaceae bacterium]|nr:delta-lactam-biosynthetic de-N-acetylase [Oscillospiraceae bacterium]